MALKDGTLISLTSGETMVSREPSKRHPRPRGNLKSTHHKQRKEQDDRAGPHQSQLFPDQCQDEVRMGFGEKEEFLLPLAQPHSKRAAAAEGSGWWIRQVLPPASLAS